LIGTVQGLWVGEQYPVNRFCRVLDDSDNPWLSPLNQNHAFLFPLHQRPVTTKQERIKTNCPYLTLILCCPWSLFFHLRVSYRVKVRITWHSFWFSVMLHHST
jgi:hypothetical protein